LFEAARLRGDIQEVKTAMPANRLANWRPWVSPVVAISFVAVAGTGVLMLAHAGDRGLRGLHETAGLAFAAAGVLHLVINWRAFLAYFRRPAALVALVVTTALCLALALAPGGAGDPARGGRFHREGAVRGFAR